MPISVRVPELLNFATPTLPPSTCSTTCIVVSSNQSALLWQSLFRICPQNDIHFVEFVLGTGTEFLLINFYRNGIVFKFDITDM